MVDAKITALDAIASIAAADLVAVVDDVSGTAKTTKGTFTQILAFMDANVTVTESQISDLGTYITISSVDTLTNKSIDLTNNTLTGTSLELKTAISDETGSGSLVFGTSPTIVTPTIASMTNAQHDHLNAAGGGTITEAAISDLGTYLTDITGEALSTLSDVTITTIADNEVLRWNGSIWINNTLAELGVSATGHTHTESDITDLGTYLTDITGEASTDLTDTAAITYNADTDVSGNGWVLDTDAMTENSATKVPTQQSVKAYVDAQTHETGIDDIVEDTTPQLGGALDGQGFDLNNLGVIFLTEQAAAEADVLTKGQIWVNSTGNILTYTNESGTDTVISLAGHAHTESDISDLGTAIALVADDLSVFAATSSLQLKTLISDETGSGALVFATSPTLVTPALGTPASGVMTNVTGTAASLTAGNVTTNANLTGDVTSVGNAAVIAADVIVNADVKSDAAIVLSKLAITETPSGSKFLRDDSSWQAIPGGGDALVANPLSQFAATTSLQLLGVMSDETGTGLLVFGTSPTIVTPTIASMTNAQHDHLDAAGGGTITEAAISDLGTYLTDIVNDTSPTLGGILVGGGFDQTKMGTISMTEQAAANADVAGDGQLWVKTATPNQLWFTADDGTELQLNVAPGSGDALTSNGLDQFAATTSLELKGVISDETGSGALVFGTSPTLVTPALGTPASGVATNITGLPITGITSSTSAQIATLCSDETGSGKLAFATSPTLVTPVLGTPSSGTLTSCTGLPITGITASTSAEIATLCSDETGSGLLVFGTSPTLTTPVLGVAAATTINKITLTQPATGGTLTIEEGFTLTADGTGSVSGTNTGDQTNISGNAATVTTNANLTGDVTSVGNATTVKTSVSLTTPLLGTPTSGNLGNCTVIPMAQASGILPDANMPNLTGDVTTIEGAVATTIVAGAVHDTMMATEDAMLASVSFVIDGGGSAITTGVKGYLEVPFNCTIESVTLLADQSGSIVIDIWKDTYANYPPIDADSITASAVPTISTATKAQDATLTGWTTTIAAGEILGFNVDSITTCERVTLALKVRKT